MSHIDTKSEFVDDDGNRTLLGSYRTSFSDLEVMAKRKDAMIMQAILLLAKRVPEWELIGKFGILPHVITQAKNVLDKYPQLYGYYANTPNNPGDNQTIQADVVAADRVAADRVDVVEAAAAPAASSAASSAAALTAGQPSTAGLCQYKYVMEMLRNGVSEQEILKAGYSPRTIQRAKQELKKEKDVAGKAGKTSKKRRSPAGK